MAIDAVWAFVYSILVFNGNTSMSIEQYIQTEFRRYFTDAEIRVRCDDETILVAVVNVADYRFDCGSDDDYYRFNRTDSLSICDYITIPLMPE